MLGAVLCWLAAASKHCLVGISHVYVFIFGVMG